MRKPLRYFKRILPTLLALFLLALLFINPKVTADGVRRGLSLCFETLFPSLFPFLILSAFLVKSECAVLPVRLLGKPLRFFLGLSQQGATALLLGLLCGFPIGTVTAVAYFEREELSKEELCRLSLFINNPSAGFLIGTVGKSLFGNEAVGVMLFLITWLASLSVGVFLRLLYGELPQKQHIPSNGIKKPSVVNLLTGSISQSFFSLFQIFSFVIFFSCITECLSAILVAERISPYVCTWLTGLLEITSGVHRAVGTMPPYQALCAAAFFAGFSGLSICLQLFSITEQQQLPLLPYLLAKGVQGGLCLLLTALYLHLANPYLKVAQSTAAFSYGHIQQIVTVSVGCICLLLILAGFLKGRLKSLSNKKGDC